MSNERKAVDATDANADKICYDLSRQLSTAGWHDAALYLRSDYIKGIVLATLKGAAQ